VKNDSIKKYLIPNIPYLFVLWAFLKLGTAYRLAAGADFAHKLMGLGQTIGPAFADFAPGLAPFDWLVGIVGAVAFRVMVYVKSKNAKKFRRDEEYGSARWGCPKDIAPFVDPKFENNIILTGTEFLTMNTRPKNPANARNLNACVIGSSGSGKTRFWLTPQILQASADKNGGCSYVCVDPKGGVLGQVGHFLQKRGYRIKVFNSIDFTKSMHYNPLAYIRNEADILKFVDALISNTKGEGKEGDPFWTKSETLLYCALIAYIIFEGPAEDRNMNTLVDMISGMEVKEDDEDFMNAVDYMFAGLEKRKPDCFAVKQYKKYKLASGKTAKSILISCGARLAPFDIPQLREVMAYDEHFAGSEEAGSVSSLPFVQQAVEEMTRVMPADQVICGIPFYTRVWTEKFGQSAITSEVLGMDGAKNYAKENQMTETWDASLGQNVATVETSDARYTIWMEDEQSMEEKLKVIQSADLAGVAEWKLGFERADVWSLISEYIETNS